QQQQQQQSKWNVGQHRRGRPTPLHRRKQQRGHREQRKHQQHDQPRLRRPQPSPRQQQQQQRREMEISLENDNDEDDLHGKHMNRTRIPCFWSRTGIWVSHARLLSLVMVLDLMILSVQIPSMPAAFESHGMDLRWQGWVASTYGIISFFVGPMLGRVSDSMGRVAMLKMSCVGNMIGALGSLYATGRWTFIASRTLPGLLKCSLPISQAYMVDVSEGSAERSKNLGMLGASFGVAFVLGPPLGGTAADYDVRLPFVISFLESVLLYLALQYLPEPSKSLASKKDDGDRTGGREGAVSSGGKTCREGGGGGGARGLGGDGGEAGLARVAAVDQAEVVAATASSFCSPKATPGSARKKTLTRIRSSLQVASESGRTTA
ncbi:unnamed protein product, partial [Ectocarpus sp. 12 AP-2014]